MNEVDIRYNADEETISLWRYKQGSVPTEAGIVNIGVYLKIHSIA